MTIYSLSQFYNSIIESGNAKSGITQYLLGLNRGELFQRYEAYL